MDYLDLIKNETYLYAEDLNCHKQESTGMIKKYFNLFLFSVTKKPTNI